MRKNTIRALLIDMDGVLFDTEAYSIPAIIDVVARQNLTITREFIIANMGVGPRDLLAIYSRHLGPKFDPDLYWDTYWTERRAYFNTHPLPVKPGAVEMLKRCQEQGVPCILATSSPQREGLHALELAKLDQYFLNAVGGDMFTHSKPQPDIYLKAAELANADIRDCLVLEDSLNGLRSGRAANAQTAMIPDIVPYSALHAPYTDHLLQTLADVIPLLQP